MNDQAWNPSGFVSIGLSLLLTGTLCLTGVRAMAAEGGEGDEAEPPKLKEEKLLEEYAKELALAQKGQKAVAEYHYEQGVEYLDTGMLLEALAELRIAADAFPDNEKYRKQLKLAESIAGSADDEASVMVQEVQKARLVEDQRLWIEVERSVKEGKRHLRIGNFDQAEDAFQMAYLRLKHLPAQDKRRDARKREVEGLIQEVKRRRERYEVSRASETVKRANEAARAKQIYAENTERRRLSMILRRAMKSRERRDYDHCILLCRRILKENPAHRAARRLLLETQRQRHLYKRKITADRWEEEHKLLSEHIRRAMLPQLTVVEYSEEWPEIDARRSVQVQAGQERAEEPWRKTIVQSLQQNISTDFVDTDISQVVQFLIRQTRINFVLDSDAVVAGVDPVTMRVNNMTLKNALDFIMQMTGLRYSIQDEAVFISNEAGVQGNVTMKTYEVRDLTLGLTMYPGPTIQLPEAGGQGSVITPEVPDENPPDINELIDIIQSVVAPDTWGGERNIEEINETMVIRQTPEIHAQIEDLLTALRNQSSVQIHVKVKFLQVENSLLERIAFEWRDFTDAGLVNAGNSIGTIGGTPVAFAPLGANGPPYAFGGYYNHNDWLVNAGRVGTPLGDFFSQTNLRPDGGFNGDLRYFKGNHGVLARLLIEAVEKTRRGNVLVEPDLTLFSGQRAFLARLFQQSYISDYDVVNGAYDPMISILSYGTVLDVQAIASADRRYITMTLRPQDARVGVWRRFGGAVDNFPGGQVSQEGRGVAFNPLIGIEYPLLIPQMNYHAVQTTITIPDGGSLLIGGMNISSSSRAHSGVPFLSHIPFLGRLFSANGRTEQELKEFIYVSGDIILLEEIEEQL